MVVKDILADYAAGAISGE